MMPIKVNFRGPMVFLSSRVVEAFNRVILPDTTLPGQHFDHTDRHAHFAGILVVQYGKSTWRLLSHAQKVRFVADGESGAPEVDTASFSLLADLQAMAETEAQYKLRRCAEAAGCLEVEMFGGVLTTRDTGSMPLEIPQHHKTGSTEAVIPNFTVWTSKTADTGYYQIDREKPERITADMQVYLYHWDSPHPEAATLETPVTRGVFEDLDMKWVYTLFEPVNKPDWDSWLGGQGLPVPHTKGWIKELHTSPMATCDGVRYVE
jgi:hypothetical protein